MSEAPTFSGLGGPKAPGKNESVIFYLSPLGVEALYEILEDRLSFEGLAEKHQRVKFEIENLRNEMQARLQRISIGQ